ncbi:MAG: NAD(P)/FAD-dependent oxidoreductase [Erysipelotrichaceae bacterium]|nr:NAD(P)/FAD-dependent oxidoreductase [Erysipelotrichaceae bacterium]
MAVTLVNGFFLCLLLYLKNKEYIIINDMNKKIVIIGGGVAGLSAGINARLNGFEAVILEKNPVLGGLCTSWDRKGMHIDGCIHWLTGTREGTSLNRLWKEVGAIDSQEDIIYLPTWGIYNYDGIEIPLYCDLAKAEEAWIKISPRDKRNIHLFFKIVKKLGSVDLPLDYPAKLLPFKMLMKLGWSVFKAMPYYFTSMQTSCEKFAKRFKSPALRWTLTHIQPGRGNLYSMAYCYATIALGNGGIPRHGSKGMIERMRDKYLELGGEIRLNTEVIKINTEHRNVKSVTLKDGSEVTGNYFVSACDSFYTLYNLLGNRYAHHQLAERYNRPSVHPAPSCVLVSYKMEMGVKLNIPYGFKVPPFKVGWKEIDHILIRDYSYEPDYIVNNHTVLQVLIDQDSLDYDYWEELRKDIKKYNERKIEIAEFVKDLIIKHIPALDNKLETIDVATPITFNRYTNASRGTYMSFLFNDKMGVMLSKGKVAGLHNFYLSGQYMQTPGGLPLALASGRFSIQWIIRKEKNKIHTLFRLNKN